MIPLVDRESSASGHAVREKLRRFARQVVLVQFRDSTDAWDDGKVFQQCYEEAAGDDEAASDEGY